MAEEIVLTKEQEELILTNGDRLGWDLGELTRLAFNDEKLSGVTKQGRIVRSFLIGNGLDVKTTEREKKPDIVLTEEHKQFIRANAGRMTSTEMARSIWQDKNIGALNKEARTIDEFKKTLDPALLSNTEREALEEYIEPKSVGGVIARLRKYSLADLAESKLTQQEKDYVESLFKCFRNYRFKKTIQGFLKKEDRELFEFQYMSYCWTKEEMSESDIQTCITIASDYVTLAQAKRQKDALDVIIDDALAKKGGGEKTKIEEGMYEMADKLQALADTTMMRIKQMTTALEGTRNERIKLMTDKNRSILVLVEAIKKEDSRKELLKQGELEQKALSAEIEKVEKANDYIARLYGISKQELLY